MPPKAQYSKAEIAAAALALIKQEGTAALTARALAKSLNTSASPIFTAFANMDEVKLAARELALAEFIDYIGDYQEYTPAFKRVGMQFVSYGIHEPELFKLVFMHEHEEAAGFQNVIKDLGDMPTICAKLIRRDYGMTQAEADLLFEQCWIHAFGLGTLCAMKVCTLSEAEIGMHLGSMFMSHVMLIKSGKLADVYPDVVQSPDGIYHGRSVQDYFQSVSNSPVPEGT